MVNTLYIRHGERSVAIQGNDWITTSPAAPRNDDAGELYLYFGGIRIAPSKRNW